MVKGRDSLKEPDIDRKILKWMLKKGVGGSEGVDWIHLAQDCVNILKHLLDKVSRGEFLEQPSSIKIRFIPTNCSGVYQYKTMKVVQWKELWNRIMSVVCY
jgi:hypothetical protein